MVLIPSIPIAQVCTPGLFAGGATEEGRRTGRRKGGREGMRKREKERDEKMKR